MAKFILHNLVNADKKKIGETLWFMCPGCNEPHRINVSGSEELKEPVWDWNGDINNPTISPSIRVRGKVECHSHIKDGKIQFLDDCSHALKGQTVEVPEAPEWLK